MEWKVPFGWEGGFEAGMAAGNASDMVQSKRWATACERYTFNRLFNKRKTDLLMFCFFPAPGQWLRSDGWMDGSMGGWQW